MAKDYDVLEMLQGSQNLYATQKLSHAQNAEMVAVEYISVAEAIVRVVQSNIRHMGAAAFKLSNMLPASPGLSPKDHSVG
jgi:hypothetical protein